VTSVLDRLGRASQGFFKVDVARSSLLKRPQGILASSVVLLPLSVALPLEFFTAVGSSLGHDHAADRTDD